MKTIYRLGITLLITALFLTNLSAQQKFKGVNFKASDEVLCSTGLSITYQNTTKGDQDDKKDKDGMDISYLWTFEGGSPKTYIGENPPKVTYTNVGTFKTTLLAQLTNQKGEVLHKEDKVMLIVVQKPVIDLGADRTICAGSAITLDAGAGYSNYRWTNGQNQGKLGDEAKLVVNTGGTYKVTAKTPLGCEASDMIEVTLRICTGVEDNIETANINMYPNPAKDRLNITAQFDKVSELKVSIINTTGIEVSTQNLNSVSNINTSIDISDLNSGLYRVNYFVNGLLAKSMPLMVK